MNSRISFFNRALFKHDISRFGILGIMYFVLTLFITNLGLVNLGVEQFAEGMEIGRVLHDYYPNPYDMMSWVVVPAGLAIVLFRFLHSGGSLISLHSMPVSRRQIFAGRSLVFIILYCIPVVMNSFFTAILMASKGYPLADSAGQLIRVTLIALFVGVTVFYLTVFAGMLVGSSLLQAVLLVIIAFLPAVMVVIINNLGSLLVEGLPMFHNMYFGPMASAAGNSIGMMMVASRYDFHWLPAMVTIAYCGASMIGAWLLYKRRALEAHKRMIAFEWSKKLFIVLTTLLVTMVSCLFGAFLLRDQVLGIYLALVPGTILGYSMARMTAEKTLHIWKYRKGLLVSVFIGIVVLGAVELDITGYERRIPDAEDIGYIYYTPNSSMDVSHVMSDYDEIGSSWTSYDTILFEEATSIDMIRGIHQKVIHQKIVDQDPYDGGMNFVYVLKNGRTLQRQYHDYKTELYEKPVYETEEYYALQERRLDEAFEQCDSIKVTQGFDKDSYTVDLEDYGSLLAAYKMDLRDQTYEEQRGLNRIGAIKVYTADGNGFHSSLSIRFSDEHTLKWLESKEWSDFLPDGEGLVEASIYKEDGKTYDGILSESFHRLVSEMSGKADENVYDTLMIKDKETLKDLFSLGYDYERPYDDSYQIHFSYEDGFRYIVTLSELPEALEQYVNYY